MTVKKDQAYQKIKIVIVIPINTTQIRNTNAQNVKMGVNNVALIINAIFVQMDIPLILIKFANKKELVINFFYKKRTLNL